MKINMMKAAAVAILILTGTAASAQTWTEWRDLQVNEVNHSLSQATPTSMLE